MTKYSAGLDNLAKLITGAILLLFIGILGSYTMVFGATHDYFVLITTYLLLGGIVFVSWYLHPVEYQLDKAELIIRRPAGNVHIPCSAIQVVKLLDKETLGLAVRTFAVGGLFGYFGKYWSRPQGNMTWYVKNRNKLLLLELESGKKIVLSPDQREEMFTFLSTNVVKN